MKKKECPICLQKFKIRDMTETSCHHFFCDECFFGILHYGGKKCALCRTVQTDWGEPIIKIESIGFINSYEILD